MRASSALLQLGVIVAAQLRNVTCYTPVTYRRTTSPTAKTQNAALKTTFDDNESCPPKSFANKNGLFQSNRQPIIFTQTLAATIALLTLLVVSPCLAVDFAGQTLSGQDFSGQDLSGKDFSTVIAQGTNFRKANLQGANFQAAKLERADFSGANLQDAKFEDAALHGTIMKDVLAQRASFSKTILDIGDLENADLSQSLWPSKYIYSDERDFSSAFVSVVPTDTCSLSSSCDDGAIRFYCCYRITYQIFCDFRQISSHDL